MKKAMRRIAWPVEKLCAQRRERLERGPLGLPATFLVEAFFTEALSAWIGDREASPAGGLWVLRALG